LANLGDGRDLKQHKHCDVMAIYKETENFSSILLSNSKYNNFAPFPGSFGI
jgi:hypothetical protein